MEALGREATKDVGGRNIGGEKVRNIFEEVSEDKLRDNRHIL